jgi:7,8-dihydro-6-hydroxymethylpterin-pyrophosphokinase
VEIELGKKFICENGPRIIDLDLLLYGDQTIETKDLSLPHPEILKRDFVLLPLHDLNPHLAHPKWGSKTLKSALSGLQEKFVEENPDDWDYQT